MTKFKKLIYALVYCWCKDNMASDPNETVEGALTKFYVRLFFLI